MNSNNSAAEDKFKKFVEKMDEVQSEKKKPGRPKGYRMSDYSLELQKRARIYKTNLESAVMMEELCKLFTKLTLDYPETPFIYGDYPYITRSSGGSLVAGPWITEYADAYSYIFTPDLSLLNKKIKEDRLTYLDLKMVWLHHVTSDEAEKMFPNPTPDFYRRFGTNKMTTMIYTKYALDSMLTLNNTGFYPLNVDFYRNFLTEAKVLAKRLPLSQYASKIRINADDLLVELKMNPYKYDVKGAELYFASHKKRMQEAENMGDMADNSLSIDDVLSSLSGDGEPCEEETESQDQELFEDDDPIRH